jgi:DNA helicase-2/ATP-dependent DNA helicase PcrA
MGTYSSICLKILREEIQRFNRSKNFTVIDEEDQSSLVKEICKLYGIDTRKITPSKLLTYIYSFKGDRYEDITDLSIENFKKFNLYS